MSRRPEERLKEGMKRMNTIAEFTIIGRVGEIKQVGSTLRVSVASSFSRRDNSGEWVERTRWNEVTVFGEGTRGYVKRNIVKGDLIFTSGSMGQTKWEKDGETFYGVTLACERIERLCKGPNHGEDNGGMHRTAAASQWTTTYRSDGRFRPGRLRPPRTPRARMGDPSLSVARLKKERSPMRKRATMAAMNLAVRKPMSLAEFLEWEERQELRYEFDGVEPSAMTGGSAAHADIQANLATAFRNRMRGKPCKFYGSDLKILVADNSIRYPDGMVVCSPVAPNATAVRDPVVIFEVLSPSTAAKDRIVKAREYQATAVRQAVRHARAGAHRRDRSCPGPGRVERANPERRGHPRHAGNRPRDPARRILRRSRVRGAPGRRQ